MSVATEFVALVSPIVEGRIYPGIAPATTVPPYVVYSRISVIEILTLDLNGGLNNLENTRMQCDVWGPVYAEVDATAQAIKAALKGWARQNTMQDTQDLYEFETRLHRVMLDISIWHD